MTISDLRVFSSTANMSKFTVLENNSSNIQMVNDCQVYFGFDLPSVIIDRQSNKFLSANVNVS